MAVEYGVAAIADASVIAAIYAPYVENTIVSFETAAPDVAEIARRIEHIGAHYPWLVARDGARIVGYAYACENRARPAYRWSVDAAIYLDPSAQRRGSGRGLYERLFALLRAQGFVNAFAGISLPNDASVGLHEALGFAPIGVYRKIGYKLGDWRDVGWWQLVLRQPSREPAEPQRFASFDRDRAARILEDPRSNDAINP